MLRVRYVYLLTVCPWLVLGLLSLLLDARTALRSHAELDYGEGIVLWQAAHVTNWTEAYHRIELPPYIVFHYPPLYHLTSRAVSLVTRDLLVAGRALSIFSLVGTSLILAILCWCCLPFQASRAARSLGAVSSGLLVFTLPSWPWACLMRVDTFAMFLSFAGVALFVAARRRPYLFYLSFALFTAAMFTKQTMAAAPLACAILLLLENARLFLRVALATAAFGLAALAVFQILTQGHFLVNIVTYNRNTFHPGQLLRFQLEHIESSGPVIAACVLIPLASLRRLRRTAVVGRIRNLLARSLFSRFLIVTTAVLILVVAVTFTVGKQGANYNYFFEMDLITSLGAGAFVGWLLSDRPRSSFRHDQRFALFVTFVLALHSTRVEPRLYEAIVSVLRPPADHSAEVVALLKRTPGRVYSEDMTVLVQAEKQIEAEPAIITTLALGRQWDEQPFLHEIENRHFSMIVVNTSLANKDRYTAGVAHAVEMNYGLKRRVGEYLLYEPR